MRGQDAVSSMLRTRNAYTGVRIHNQRARRSRLVLTRRHLFMMALVLFLIMGSGIGYVWSNFQSTRMGYSLSQLKEKELKFMERNRKLKLELAVLKSPQNLVNVARKLGFKSPSYKQIIILQ